MNNRSVITLLALATLGCAALADQYTFTVVLPSTESGGWLTLFDRNGQAFGGPSNITPQDDYDYDGISETGTYELTYSSVTPGKYSIAAPVYDPSTSQWATYWSALNEIAQITSITAFPNTSPPIGSGPGYGDEGVTGNFDIRGNVLTFGTEPAGETAMQMTYNPYWSTLDTALTRRMDGWESATPAAMTWSFPSSQFPETDFRAMSVESSGTFTVRTDSGGYIELNPQNGTISINGQPLQTPANLQNGAFTSLRGGGASSASVGSIAFGSGASATGSNSAAFGAGLASAAHSFASGVGTEAKAFGAAVFGTYNSSPAGQNTSGWFANDDLFVIGNGTSVSARSNAVTIKKDGATFLHGAVTIGSSTAGSVTFNSGGGERIISVANGGQGTNLRITAGGTTNASYYGGNLILSSGGVPASGNTGSSILFQTASSADGPISKTRMTLNRTGALGIGSGALTGAHYESYSGLDVAYGGVPATLFLGAEVNFTTRTENTLKVATIVSAPYTSTRPGPMMMYAINDVTASYLNIGGGGGNAVNEMRFYTAPTLGSPANESNLARLIINKEGGISAGTGTMAASDSIHGPSQFVVGRFNNLNTNGAGGTDHTEGLFIVGAGNGVLGDPNERRNALRVNRDGAVLVKESGDIGMGEFVAGEQP